MPEIHTIILVGHCRPDRYLLISAVSRAIPGAQITSVNDAAALEQVSLPGALLLINRVLEGDFPNDSGAEMIRSLLGRAGTPTMMLVSNFEDAQAEAVAAGALPGFGKSQLHLESTMQRLREAGR